MKIPARLVSVAAIAVVAAGCSAVNPITTQQAYDASDGVSVDLGDIRAINLIVVSEAEGSPAVLIGSFHNLSDEDTSVAASIDGESIVDVDVPAGATVRLGGEEGEAHVTGTAPAGPGLIADVTFQVTGFGQTVREVPIMDGTLEEYAMELENL